MHGVGEVLHAVFEGQGHVPVEPDTSETNTRAMVKALEKCAVAALLYRSK